MNDHHRFLLEKYLPFYEDLCSGRRAAETEAQKHFLAVVRDRTEGPVTDHEVAYLEYLVQKDRLTTSDHLSVSSCNDLPLLLTGDVMARLQALELKSVEPKTSDEIAFLRMVHLGWPPSCELHRQYKEFRQRETLQTDNARRQAEALDIPKYPPGTMPVPATVGSTWDDAEENMRKTDFWR